MLEFSLGIPNIAKLYVFVKLVSRILLYFHIFSIYYAAPDIANENKTGFTYTILTNQPFLPYKT